jgi:hypothetical protein
MCSQVLDRLKMVFISKSNANLVMNITCVLLNLSRALKIFECINLCVQDLFLSELLQAMISLARDYEAGHSVLRIYLIASLLSMHCVSPHRRSHKPRWMSTLKPNIIFSEYLLDHNLSSRMDHQLKEDCKMVLTLKISSISPKEKYFRYLSYLYHLFARGRATSKHEGGGRYNAILEFKGEQIKNCW